MISRGLFAVYKPRGVTSAQVTNKIKKVLQEKGPVRVRKLKVGHGGTLDHLAEGVLVVGVGADCKRLTSYLAGGKCYEAVGELGRETDTGDSDGKVVAEKPYKHVEYGDIEEVLRTFHGDITQTPPTYSALKRGGRRISDLAREGEIVIPNPRQVSVHAISLVHFQPPYFKIAVSCSGGTYIRSLVRDIGLGLGTVAHVIELRRTRQGPFSLDNALTEDQWTYVNIRQMIESVSQQS